MINIYKASFLTLLISAFAFSSCTDLLDIQPVHSMKPETINDYESILLGGYPRVDYFMRTELLTDNTVVNLNSNYKPSAADEAWYLFASSHLLETQVTDPYWGQLYKSIYYANTVLDRFEEITPETSERTTYEKVKGEALALRAYAYFYLINLYADVYDEANLNLPGVPMPLTARDVNENSQNNVRTPIGKVWGQIVEDLKQASELLQGKDMTDRYRLNFNSVQLLCARVALFMKDYDRAIEHASYVMGSAKLSNLATMQGHIDDKSNRYAFSGNFGFINTDYNKEILFFTGGRANNNIYYYYAGGLKPSMDLLQLATRNGDLTDYRQHIFASFEDPLSANGLPIGETCYYMYATQENYSYYIGFKASEAYVIRAEAYARKKEYAKALTDINNILITRYKSGVYSPLLEEAFTNKEDILKRVLEERRLETAFDGGLRFLDLRRLGKPEVEHFYKNGEKYTLKENDPKYVLQIPQSEQISSPDMPINPR